MDRRSSLLGLQLSASLRAWLVALGAPGGRDGGTPGEAEQRVGAVTALVRELPGARSAEPFSDLVEGAGALEDRVPLGVADEDIARIVAAAVVGHGSTSGSPPAVSQRSRQAVVCSG